MYHVFFISLNLTTWYWSLVPPPHSSKMQQEGILESFHKIDVSAVGVFGTGSQGKPFFQFIHPFVLQTCFAQNSAKIDECHFVNSRGLYVTPWNSSDTSLDWQTANKSEGVEGDMVQEPNLGREGRGAGSRTPSRNFYRFAETWHRYPSSPSCALLPSQYSRPRTNFEGTHLSTAGHVVPLFQK